MNDIAVSIKGLVKRYGDFTAVNGIDLEVKRGEVFGLLGANGAGKTTTFECLEGLRKVNKGKISIAGCDPQQDEYKLHKKLGVQLQSSSLPGCIKVKEAIELVCSWQGATKNSSIIDKFGIRDLLNKQYHQLSIGQKRRVHLALALLNNPEVLVLDEPTAGLDVQSRAQLHDEIRTIKSEGITVLLATHDMAEAESLCDRIAILVHGKIVVCDSPEMITAAGNKETRIRLRTAKGSLLPGHDIGKAVFISEKDGYLEWKSQDIAESVIEIVKKVLDSGDTVEDLRVERPTLEEMFIALSEGVQ
ncbi:MAG: ABC transporter ATP-binding protein [Bacillota bacterium]|nr:ABC transporter ATP-binding protein [Bacillota bacterium]